MTHKVNSSLSNINALRKKRTVSIFQIIRCSIKPAFASVFLNTNYMTFSSSRLCMYIT